jgi:ABC-type antimicrobial peptide transport system permease subunit
MRLLPGRLLDARDVAGQPLVTVVNETMARTFFPTEDPIGRRITVDMTSYFPTLTIVGVVADTRMHGADQPYDPLLFWSMSQFPSPNAWLLVKSRTSALGAARSVDAELRRIAPDVAVSSESTLESAFDDSLWRPRFVTTLMGLFAAVALVLAIAGVYGVISYVVSRRAREMRLRVVLGASPWEVVRLVVLGAVVPCLVGVAVGLLIHLLASAVLGRLLFDVPVNDPATLALVALAAVTIAAVASFVPARRVLELDPTAILRDG